MKKLMIATSLLLATLAATPTFAATRHARVQSYATNTAGYEANASADNRLTVRGPAVIAYGQYAGWDPDPSIRFQLLRDPPGLSD